MKRIKNIFGTLKVVVDNDSVKQTTLANTLEDDSIKSNSRSVMGKQHYYKKTPFFRESEVAKISLSDNAPAKSYCKIHTVFGRIKHIIHCVLIPALKYIWNSNWFAFILILIVIWVHINTQEGGLLWDK